jgi:hypothetical protein
MDDPPLDPAEEHDPADAPSDPTGEESLDDDLPELSEEEIAEAAALKEVEERRVRRALLELAEEPALRLPAAPRRIVFQGEGFAFFADGVSASVQRLRLKPSEVERTVDRIAAILGVKELTEATWWVGRRSRPKDLADRLAELGLEPGDPPRLTTLTIAGEPGGEAAIEVRRVATSDELLQALEIDWACFDIPEEEREIRRREAVQTWPALEANPGFSTYLAYVDGEPVGFGRAIFTADAGLLLGGATLPQARGQGVYTSIVHARWQEASERGVPRLVVSAGARSAPILEQIGFERIGRVRLFKQKV